MLYRNIELHCASHCLCSKYCTLHRFPKRRPWLGLGSQRLLNSLAPSAGTQSPRNNANAALCLHWDKKGGVGGSPMQAVVQTHLPSACHKPVKPIVSSVLVGRGEWDCRFPDNKPSQANGSKGSSCGKLESLSVAQHPAWAVQGAPGLYCWTCEGISPAYFAGSSQDQMIDMVRAWAFFMRVAKY